jgi:hypothetical protein
LQQSPLTAQCRPSFWHVGLPPVPEDEEEDVVAFGMSLRPQPAITSVATMKVRRHFFGKDKDFTQTRVPRR